MFTATVLFHRQYNLHAVKIDFDRLQNDSLRH